MGNVAIVAIPSNDSFIRRISSEKIPHLTLLFLGDKVNPDNISQIRDFVEHAAVTSLRRFELFADKRDKLGPSNADVIFFKGDGLTALNKFRHELLTNRHIAEAYNSTPQHDVWVPHMTLGYPETPAKPDTRDNAEYYWLKFDSIALWTGEYEGPEFDLKDEERVYMSEPITDFLAHYGVRGMRWGVRSKRTIEKVKGSDDHEKAKDLAKRPTKSLSNSEIRAITQRMQLEKSYSDLSKSTNPVMRGTAVAKDVLSVAGTATALYAVAKSPMVTAIKEAVAAAVIK